MVTMGRIMRVSWQRFLQEPFSTREIFEHQRILHFTGLQFPALCKRRPTPAAVRVTASEHTAASAADLRYCFPPSQADWQQHPRSVFPR